MGMVGVEVAVGEGVFEGIAVSVGVLVDEGWVADGVIRDNVGVGVGALEGRLQADMAKIKTSINIKTRDFISRSFSLVHYLIQKSRG
jgi:hypothetical protein